MKKNSERNSPPRAAQWLVKKIFSDSSTRAGDFEEVYSYLAKEKSVFKARLWYGLQIIISLKPFAENYLSRSFGMIKNYWKIALRNLTHYKTYSLINMLNMTIGISSCLLIIIYINDEINYDQHYKNSDNMYRLVLENKTSGAQVSTVAFPVGKKLKELYPDVQDYVRLFRAQLSPHSMAYEDKLFNEENLFFADPNFFEVFDVELMEGAKTQLLSDINSVVISEKIAEKYFQHENPIGKLMTFAGKRTLKVTGVFKDFSHNTHFNIDLITPLEVKRLEWYNPNNPNSYDIEKDWMWTAAWTYIVLHENVSSTDFEAKLPEFVSDNFHESNRENALLSLQPITDIHLQSDMLMEIEMNGDMNNLYIFGAIGFLILLIASINYMGLSTSRYATRSKEIGVRRVVGANRKQLISQILTESLLLNLIAAVFAILVIFILLPEFNNVAGKNLSGTNLLDKNVVLTWISVTLIVGVLSGSYPALFYSSLSPGKVLYGRFNRFKHGISLRKYIVLTQSATTFLLITSVLVITDQLTFLTSKNLGFDEEQIILLNDKNPTQNEHNAIKEKLKSISGISAVSTTVYGVPGNSVYQFRFVPEGRAMDQPEVLTILAGSYEYRDLFDLELTAGRFFSRDFSRDPQEAFLLNETAVKLFGWKEDAIGKKLDMYIPGGTSIGIKGKVIGVVRDFHSESLHQPIKPLAIMFRNIGNIAVKLNTENISDVIHKIEDAWKSTLPRVPFEFSFLDQDIDRLYQDEKSFIRIVNTFAVITIMVSCLGLYGLISFLAAQRTKEIGIRKVLGASSMKVVTLVSNDILKLVVFANIIAWPIVYYILHIWLKNFAYTINFGFDYFLVSSAIVVIITCLSISFQTIKAALNNPVDSLKNE